MDSVLVENLSISFANHSYFDEIVNLLNEITESIKQQKNWNRYNVTADREKQKKTFETILNSQSKVFVARVNSEIVGVLNLQIVSNIRHGWLRGHIEEIVVKKEFRRKGIGSKLLQEVIDYCRDNNIRMLKLMCGNQLLESQKFYENNNFVFKDKGYRLEIK